MPRCLMGLGSSFLIDCWAAVFVDSERLGEPSPQDDRVPYPDAYIS